MAAFEYRQAEEVRVCRIAGCDTQRAPSQPARTRALQGTGAMEPIAWS